VNFDKFEKLGISEHDLQSAFEQSIIWAADIIDSVY